MRLTGWSEPNPCNELLSEIFFPYQVFFVGAEATTADTNSGVLLLCDFRIERTVKQKAYILE